MDFPVPGGLPQFIGSYSKYCVASDVLRQSNKSASPSTIAWTNANQAIYMPFSIPFSYPVQRVFWSNGSAVAATNADFGIYTPGGARIYSTGSTTVAGASAIQYVTVSTPFVLDPGSYFFAWTVSNTTNRTFGIGSLVSNAINICGCLSQTSALPLPASATFASCSVAVIPICGITRTASGF